MNVMKKAVQLIYFTSAMEWVHDLYTVVDCEKCNELSR